MCINDSDNSYSESWWNYPYRAIANANLAYYSYTKYRDGCYRKE